MNRTIIGPLMDIDRVYVDPNGSRRITASQGELAMTKAQTVTENELRPALRDALIKKLQPISPHGERIGEAPDVLDVAHDPDMVIFRHDGRLWKAPFLVNTDRTCTVGTPALSGLSYLTTEQQVALKQAVAAMYRPWSEPGDAPPRIVEIQAQAAPLSRPTGRVIVGFKSEHASVPYAFDSPTGPCWVTMGTPVERKGSSFQVPSTTTGLEIDLAAKFLQRVMAARGEPLSYGEAMRCASKHLGGALPSEKPAITAFLGVLLNSLEKKGGV